MKNTNTNTTNVTIDENLNVNTDLDQEPIQEIPYEDIILNLGFWLEMAQRQGKIIAQRKFNGLSKSE